MAIRNCLIFWFLLPAVFCYSEPLPVCPDSSVRIADFIAAQKNVESCFRWLDRLEQWRDEVNRNQTSDSFYCYLVQKALTNHRLAELQVGQLSELALLRLQELALDQLTLAINIRLADSLSRTASTGTVEFRLLQTLQTHWHQAYTQMKETQDYQILVAASLDHFFHQEGAGIIKSTVLPTKNSEKYFLLSLWFYFQQK